MKWILKKDNISGWVYICVLISRGLGKVDVQENSQKCWWGSSTWSSAYCVSFAAIQSCFHSKIRWILKQSFLSQLRPSFDVENLSAMHHLEDNTENSRRRPGTTIISGRDSIVCSADGGITAIPRRHYYTYLGNDTITCYLGPLSERVMRRECFSFGIPPVECLNWN